jgi:hypothetical protein
MKIKTSPLSILLLILISLTLLLRWQITVLKPFDPDELSHLHTSWLITHGSLPYKDFFYGYPPTFTLLLSPFFIFLPPSDIVPVLIRQLFFLITIAIFYLIYKISRSVMDRNFSLLTILLLATSVFFLERGVEIRPDIFVLFLWILSAYLLVKSHLPLPTSHIVLTGLLTGLSATITQKSIYGVIFISILVIFYLIKSDKTHFPHCFQISNSCPELAERVKFQIITFAISFSVFPLLLLLTLFQLGLLPYAFNYLVKLPLNLGQIYQWDHPWYHLGFSPDFTHNLYFQYFYKSSSLWLIATQVSWILAILLTPLWVMKRPRDSFYVFLSSGLVIFSVYLLAIPLKIPQYWLFLAPFIPLTLSYSLFTLSRKFRILYHPILFLSIITTAIVILNIGQIENSDLSTNNNLRQRSDLLAVLANTSVAARGYDGISSYIYRPDCYYFGMVLPTEIPKSIYYGFLDDLEKGKCDFILKGLFSRMDSWGSGENYFIDTHYSALPTAPDLFLKNPI